MWVRSHVGSVCSNTQSGTVTCYLKRTFASRCRLFVAWIANTCLQTLGTKGGGLKASRALPGDPAAYPLNGRSRHLGECTRLEMPLRSCNAVKKNSQGVLGELDNTVRQAAFRKPMSCYGIRSEDRGNEVGLRFLPDFN